MQAEGTLFALDVTDGRTVWRCASAETVAAYGDRRGVIVWERPRVLIAGPHVVRGLDTGSGRAVWTESCRGELVAIAGWEDGAVAVTTDSIIGYAPAVGATWRLPLPRAPGDGSLAPGPTVWGKHAYVGGYGRLLCVDCESGKVRWERRTRSQAGHALRCLDPPTIADDRVLTVWSDQGTGQVSVYCHADDGTLAWCQPTVNYRPLIGCGLLWGQDSPDAPVSVVVPGPRDSWPVRKLCAYNLRDGELAWVQEHSAASGGGWYLADEGRHLLLADGDRIVALSWSSGDVEWVQVEVPTSGIEFVSTPREWSWTYVVGSRETWAMSRTDGEVLGRLNLRPVYDSLVSHPTLGPRGTLVLSSLTPIGADDDHLDIHTYDVLIAVRLHPPK